jgi:hypothetical protein
MFRLRKTIRPIRPLVQTRDETREESSKREEKDATTTTTTTATSAATTTTTKAATHRTSDEKLSICRILNTKILKFKLYK